MHNDCRLHALIEVHLGIIAWCIIINKLGRTKVKSVSDKSKAFCLLQNLSLHEHYVMRCSGITRFTWTKRLILILCITAAAFLSNALSSLMSAGASWACFHRMQILYSSIYHAFTKCKRRTAWWFCIKAMDGERMWDQKVSHFLACLNSLSALGGRALIISKDR